MLVGGSREGVEGVTGFCRCSGFGRVVYKAKRSTLVSECFILLVKAPFEFPALTEGDFENGSPVSFANHGPIQMTLQLTTLHLSQLRPCFRRLQAQAPAPSPYHSRGKV